jgi:uncharacterized protein YutE (UPF0331/DUF86 family)
VTIAQLARSSDEGRGSPAGQAFEVLREAGVIDGALCRRLTRAQSGRVMIEHGYPQISAGDVHRTAELVREAARDFIGSYRAWIEPYLDTPHSGS